jgi:RNA polymerase sigma-70 factor (ECF subfamily)
MHPRDHDDLAGWPSILDRAREGSAADFEQIYTSLAPVVAGYLRMSGVRDVDAVTNEVFLHVLRGIRRFRGEWPGFRSWVFTIAHHRMVDDRRATARRPTIVPMESIGDRAPTGNAEHDALDALSDDRLRSLLDGLSADQRAVLLLRIVADLPLEQVADTVDKSVGAVKALQHRALASLRRALTTEDADT